MKMKWRTFANLVIIFILFSTSDILAQTPGPFVIVQESSTMLLTSPEVKIPLSIIDTETGQTIKGLTNENFQIKESSRAIANFEVSSRSAGLAIVVVVDRRAISNSGVSQTDESINLIRQLVTRLSVTGASHDDMIALVGVAQNGILEPEVYFVNPIDLNMVLNALNAMGDQPIDGLEGISIFAKINEAGQVQVTDVYEGGAAHKAGIQIGDRILEVNNVPMVDTTLQEVAGAICGPANTEVDLRIERPTVPSSFDVTVIRSQTVVTGDIGASLIVNSDGYLEIEEIYPGFPAEQAGLFVHDRIAVVDGITITQSTHQETIRLTSGAPDSEVALLIVRRGMSEPFAVTLTRIPVELCQKATYSSPFPYSGLEEALKLFTMNPDATIRDLLSQRRKIIVAFTGSVASQYTDAVRESYIVQKANNAGISIYPIGVASPNDKLIGEEYFRRFATYTNGLYFMHNNSETQQDILKFFDGLMTQRQQYILTYETHKPRGVYPLGVIVNTEIGSAEAELQFNSALELPILELRSPVAGTNYPLLYVEDLKTFQPITLPLNVEVTWPDGISRAPTEVRYFANGQLIGRSTTSPTFSVDWVVDGDLGETSFQQFTLSAEAIDSYLGQVIKSRDVDVHISGGQETLPSPIEPPLPPAETQWASVILLPLLLIGMVVLLIMLLRTRRELAGKVLTRTTTGFIKGVTQRLSGGSSASVPAYAQLVVSRGRNPGTEFKIAAPIVKIGRDPQFCDFALYDQYMSNPHFSIIVEQNQFFIVDEGSTNGTRLNGSLIAVHQRMPLMPEAIIEAGQVQMQFKRVGGTTRQLGEDGETFQQQPYADPMPFARDAAPQQPYDYPGEQPQTPSGGSVTQPLR